MNLKQGLVALESAFVTEPIILTMPDGSRVRLNGPGDLAARLLACSLDEQARTPEQN
jgi:hypothetical protein